MQWLAGMTMTAGRLRDFDDPDDSTTTGATAASGWSVSTFSGTKKSGMTWVNLVVQRTGGTIGETSSGSGNTAETACATLPDGWLPPETITALWGSTSNDGRATISTAGVITISTTSGSLGITSGDSIRITETWPY